MRLNRPLLLLCSLFVFATLNAQDIHFTQFTQVPLSVSPAQTALFNGSYRIGGLYRSQWNGGVKNGYQTPVIFVDVPIKGLRQQDWIGIGFNLHRDQAGVASLTNSLAALNVAYHMGLDKKMTNVLSFGVQGGFSQRRVSRDLLRFQDAIVNGGTSVDVNGIAQQGKSYTDFSAGVNLRSQASKTTTVNVGVSVEHLTGPKYSLITATGVAPKLPRRFNIYGSMDVALNKRFLLYPAVIFRSVSGVSEVMAQGLLGFKIDPKKNFVVRGGLGYRLADAAQAIFGIDFGDIRAGVAYDFTVSELRTNSQARDGFEIAVSYIGKIYKKPSPPRVILCPKY